MSVRTSLKVSSFWKWRVSYGITGNQAIGPYQTLARFSPVFTVIRLDLYDLSDPARLAAADAETFPVGQMHPLARPGCRDWVRPDAPLKAR